MIDYVLVLKPFHARFGFIVQSFTADQFLAVFQQTLLNWYHHVEQMDKLKMTKRWMAAALWTESKLVCKMKAYADL